MSDAFKLGRLLLRNGDFMRWPTGNANPLHWYKSSQNSWYLRTAGMSGVHSGTTGLYVLASSDASTNPVFQYERWSGNGNWLNAILDNSLLYDGRQHQLTFHGWFQCQAGSGETLRPRVTTHTNCNAIGDLFAAGFDWQPFEESNYFQGSNDMYLAINRSVTSINVNFYLADLALILDEMQLTVGWDAQLATRAEAWDFATQLGRPRYWRRETRTWTLPLEAVTPAERRDLLDWQRGSFPLALRLATSSAGAPIYTVAIIGGEAGVALVEDPEGNYSGTIVLEES